MLGRSIEHGTIDEAALIVYQHLVSLLRYFALALHKHLVLQS